MPMLTSKFVNCHFRLKFMQVIGLVPRDGFLAKYNISIPTDDFIDVLKSFLSFYDLGRKPFVDGIKGN